MGEDGGNADPATSSGIMALDPLDTTKLRIKIAPAKGHTGHGGQVAVVAMCKQLGL